MLCSKLLLVVLCAAWYVSTAQGQEFSLKRYGTRLASNSIININRIGRQYTSSYSWYQRYSAEGPLVCHTNNPTCCRASDDPVDHEETGEWYYPDGTVVESLGSGFYVTRERMEIWLHKYSSSRTGVYCCDIPSVNSTGNMTEGVVTAANFSTSNVSTTAKCIGIYDYATLRKCPDLSISRGYVSYDSPYIPGRVATYSCQHGYSIVGSSTRVCTSRGWNGHAPSCQVDCGPLDNPNNGRVDTPQGTTRGRVATYSCNSGYKLKGSTVRTCGYYRYRFYGGWSGSEAPICVDHAMVQLKFSPSTYCLQWDVKKARLMDSAMRAAIQEATAEGGAYLYSWNKATITLDNVENGFFTCRGSQNETTYRTTIVGTESISASTLVRLVQRWVESGPTVRVEWYVVDIEKSCPAAIQSLYQNECGVDPKLQRCMDFCNGAGKRF